MINILKSGKDKVFVEKCQHCGTDFSYQMDDVTRFLDNNLVKCPLCEEFTTASFSTMYDDDLSKLFGYRK